MEEQTIRDAFDRWYKSATESGDTRRRRVGDLYFGFKSGWNAAARTVAEVDTLRGEWRLNFLHYAKHRGDNCSLHHCECGFAELYARAFKEAGWVTLDQALAQKVQP